MFTSMCMYMSIYSEYDDVARLHFHRLSVEAPASFRGHGFHLSPEAYAENGGVNAVPVLDGDISFPSVFNERHDSSFARDLDFFDISVYIRVLVKLFRAFGDIVSRVTDFENTASEEDGGICPDLRIYLTDNSIHLRAAMIRRVIYASGGEILDCLCAVEKVAEDLKAQMPEGWNGIEGFRRRWP